MPENERKLTTDVTINAKTIIITSRAIKMPLQLRWFGFAETSCNGRVTEWSILITILMQQFH